MGSSLKKFILFALLVGGIAGGFYFGRHPEVVSPPRTQQSVSPINPNPEPPPAQEPTVPDGVKSAFQLAVTGNKKVFLFLTTDNCIYCERMKKRVFRKMDMSPYVYFETNDKNVINFYLKNNEGFPTFILLDKTGKELKRHSGYMSMPDLKNWLTK